MSYDPAAWHDFFVMLGGAAAALTGLVFVALSLHLDRVVADPFHRFRAGVSVAGLTSMVVLSGATWCRPRLTRRWASSLISVFFVWLNITGGRHPVPVVPGAVRPPTRLLYGLATTVVYMLAGLAFLIGSGSGFLILAAAMGNSMVASIKTAWDLMIQLRHVAEA